jgi:hypothetical protein
VSQLTSVMHVGPAAPAVSPEEQRRRQSGPIGILSRNFLPENVETTDAVERGLLLHELPAVLGFVVEQHLKAALASGIFVRVVRTAELFDAVLPLSAHGVKGTATQDPGDPHRAIRASRQARTP